MKYASEVIDLLAAYPGKEFRMAQIVRHVTKGRAVSPVRRHAIRKGVSRVLHELHDSGQVRFIKDGETSAFYAWCLNLRHEHSQMHSKVPDNCDVN